MAETPIPISQHDWDCQKDNFVELYHRRKLPLQNNNGRLGVIQIMRDEHNFSASLSQYEAQIRRWGIPKNLKRHEWTQIIAKMDELKAGGMETRLKVAGSLVSADKIKQKRRRYLRVMPTPSNVAESPPGPFLWDSPRFNLEILTTNGRWSPYSQEKASTHTSQDMTLSPYIIDTEAGTTNAISRPQERSIFDCHVRLSIDEGATQRPLPAVSSHDVLSLPCSREDAAGVGLVCNTEHLESVLDFDQDTLASGYERNVSPHFSEFRSTAMFDVSGIDRTFSRSPLSQALLLPVTDAAETRSSCPEELLTGSFIEDNFETLLSKWQEDSPFFLLENQIRSLSITSTSRSEQSYLMLEPRHNTISLSNELSQKNRDQKTTAVFREIASIASTAQMTAAILGQERLTLNHRFKVFADCLGSLLPDNVHELSSPAGILDAAFLDSPFHRAILYSTINGFAGLPRVTALPLLQNFSSLFGLAKFCSPLAVRSFVDNAFGAAVWSGNAQTVDFLLRISQGTSYAIDVNKVIATKDEVASMPIEVALRDPKLDGENQLRYPKQCLEIAEALLKAGAEPTLALRSLMRNYHCADSATSRIIRDALDRGAKPDRRSIQMAMFHEDAALAEVLLVHGSRASYRIYFEDDDDDDLRFQQTILELTARNIGNSDAKRIIKSVLYECPRSEVENTSPNTYEETINRTLAQACIKGNKELVEIMLPFVTQVSSTALAAAIRNGQQPLIDLLMESGADRCSYPYIRSRWHPNCPYDCIYSRGRTESNVLKNLGTPLAEAIRSGNRSLVQKLEDTLYGSPFWYIESALVATADVGDLDYILTILQKGGSLGKECGRYALCVAVDHNRNDIVFRLLDACAGVDATPSNSRPLSHAITARAKKLVEAILEHDPDLSDPCYIREAVLVGDVDIVKILLSSQASVSLRALRTALGEENPTILNILLDHFWRHDPFFQKWNGDVLIPDRVPYGDHDLMRQVRSAAGAGNDTLLVSLLEHGARVGSGTLGAAMRRKDSAMIERLWTFAMAPEITLDAVVKLKDPSMLRQWLSKGSNPFREGAFLHAMRFNKGTFKILMEAFRARYPQGLQGWGGNLLKTAIRKSDLSLLRELLAARMDVNSFGECIFMRSTKDGWFYRDIGFTPLGFAIHRNKGKVLDVVQMLLDAGSEPNGIARSADTGGFGDWKTPLLLAIETGNLELIQVILRGGADVNLAARNGRKRTPLQKACELCSLPIVELLLSWQADVNGEAAIIAGGTALQLAAIGGSVQIAKLLLEKDADVRAQPARIHGRTPFEGAAEHGRLGILKVIWDAKFPEGISVEEASTAIHFARTNGHRGCEQYIRYLVPMADVSELSENRKAINLEVTRYRRHPYSRERPGDRFGDESFESADSNDDISSGEEDSESDYLP